MTTKTNGATVKTPRISFRGIYYKWYKLPFVPHLLLTSLILLLSFLNLSTSKQLIEETEWREAYKKALDVCLQAGSYEKQGTIQFGKHVFTCQINFLTEI